MLAAGVAAAILGASLGGCSTSYKLGGLFGSDNGDEKGASTTATAAVPASGRRDGADADLVFAKAAAVELLARGAKDVSQPWENPRTGARGTVTAIAAAYAQDGTTCRDFLASYLRGSQESWFQGGACRNGSRWEVRDLRPLQRS